MKSKILFNSDAHTYTNGDKISYTSVSTLISKFKRPYNTDYWSTYKAYEKVLGTDQFKKLKRGSQYRLEDYRLFEYLNDYVKPGEVEVAILEILEDWKNKKDTSIIKGNKYHSYKEHQAITSGVSHNAHLNRDFKTINSVKVSIKNNIEYREPVYERLKDLEPGFHPELILWNNDHQLAGQADMVYIDPDKGNFYVDINDFKTNKKIDTSNFFGKMLSPLNHLDCCNYNHYRLQISTYAWMLEQDGYAVRNLRFTHLNKPYIFEYMKDEVELMLGITEFDKI